MFTSVGQPMSLGCDAVCGGEVWEGTMPLAPPSASFQSLLLLPTIKLGPSGANSRVGGFVYILGPCWSPQQTVLWSWEFILLLPQPPLVFSIRCLRLYFLTLEPWVVWSDSLPSCSSWFICMPKWDCLLHRPMSHLVCHLATCPLCPSWLSPPFLLLWMNVPSLTPWLSGFHTVQFSDSSGQMFLNLLLTFFGLCKEAKRIYLRLHLGQKSSQGTFKAYKFLSTQSRITKFYSLGKKRKDPGTSIFLSLQDGRANYLYISI